MDDKIRHELPAPVRDDLARHSKAGDPVGQQGLGAGHGGGIRDRNNLRPAREAVNHCHEVLEASRRRQLPDEVDMDYLKAR